MENINTYNPPADLLQDQIILITGAANGIGAAASKSFAQHGASVVLLDKNVTNLESVYDDIAATGAPQPALYPMDLQGATPHHYAELTDTLRQEFGHLNGLLHCAALLGNRMPITQYDAQLWVDTIQVNLNARFLLTQACLPLLREAPDASVVFATSEVGRQGRAYWGAYGAADAGVENLMQTLADELEANTHIRVNSIDPGAVRTVQRARAFPGEDPNSLPEPAAIMPALLYLFGADSRHLTGQQFSAQG
jgi:NAD(P)-dependent dehydrogenase (short-subunit alcohol dehydrogenase family)